MNDFDDDELDERDCETDTEEGQHCPCYYEGERCCDCGQIDIEKFETE